MAIAVTPKFEQEINLETIIPQHWLILAIEVAQKLGWQIRFLSEHGLVAYSNPIPGKQNNELTVRITGSTVSLRSQTTTSGMIDWGKNKKNVADLLSGIEEIKNNYSTQQLDEIFAQFSLHFPPPELDILLQQPPPKEKPINLLSIFIPRKGFWITPILIDINILVFILMTATGADVMSPNSAMLLKWGANFKPLTLGGEWWRLISCCFIHIGATHLLVNMYALLFIGILLEARLGAMKFLVAYLLTGITSSMTSLWWHDVTISAGASGAIFGMYGVFLAMLTTSLIEKSERKRLLVSIGIFVIYNLAGGLKGGVDNAAHIGGLLGGLFVGYAFYPGLKNKDARGLQIGGVAVAIVVVLLSSFVVFNKMPNNTARYEKLMERFSQNEKTSLEVYKFVDTASTEKLLPYLNEAVSKWEENVRVLDSVNLLHMSTDVTRRNGILQYYSKERVESFKILYRSKKEHTTQYDAAQKLHYSNIDSVLKVLTGKAPQE